MVNIIKDKDNNIKIQRDQHPPWHEERGDVLGSAQAQGWHCQEPREEGTGAILHCSSNIAWRGIASTLYWYFYLKREVLANQAHASLNPHL